MKSPAFVIMSVPENSPKSNCGSPSMSGTFGTGRGAAPIFTNPDGLFRQTICHPYAWALQYAHGIVLDLAVESETYEVARLGQVPYLDVAATHDPEKGLTTLLILNRDLAKARDLEVVWREAAPSRVVTCQVLTGSDLKAFNSFEAPNRVAPQALEAPKPGARMTFQVPPRSYVVAHLAS